MSQVTTVGSKGRWVKYAHHSLLEATMTDNQQNVNPLLDSSIQEKIDLVRQNANAFYDAIQAMAENPTTETLVQLRDKAFSHAENEFELGSILNRVINQTGSIDEDGCDLDGVDYKWADDQMMFGLIEEAFALLKDSSDLLTRMQGYRRHILLELEENDELPRALSGIHDTLLERLEMLGDVRDDL
jgi:hypothetical protein